MKFLGVSNTTYDRLKQVKRDYKLHSMEEVCNFLLNTMEEAKVEM